VLWAWRKEDIGGRTRKEERIMTCNYTRSPDGNIIVVSRGHALLIWADGMRYITTHPDAPPPYDARAMQVEVSDDDGMNDVIHRINEQHRAGGYLIGSTILSHSATIDDVVNAINKDAQ
jgi:hypothetical protein